MLKQSYCTTDIFGKDKAWLSSIILSTRKKGSINFLSILRVKVLAQERPSWRSHIAQEVLLPPCSIATACGTKSIQGVLEVQVKPVFDTVRNTGVPPAFP
jgi:hypothetical protein